MTRRQRAFTLIELMVVVGIIIILTALSVPAVKKFMDGQRLDQSGRILQSAFNEARRAAISQRTYQYLIFFRETDENGITLYGVRRYRDRFGYEGDGYKLLPNVMVDLDPLTTGGTGPMFTSRARGVGVPIFDGLPPQDHATLFQGTLLRPALNSYGWIEFRKDGTINLTAPLNRNLPNPTSAAVQVFDPSFFLNSPLPDTTVNDVDMNLVEQGLQSGADDRCFLDIDPNTGRLRFRVVRMAASS